MIDWASRLQVMAQSGKKIDEADALELEADADTIIDLLNDLIGGT